MTKIKCTGKWDLDADDRVQGLVMIDWHWAILVKNCVAESSAIHMPRQSVEQKEHRMWPCNQNAFFPPFPLYGYYDASIGLAHETGILPTSMIKALVSSVTDWRQIIVIFVAAPPVSLPFTGRTCDLMVESIRYPAHIIAAAPFLLGLAVVLGC